MKENFINRLRKNRNRAYVVINGEPKAVNDIGIFDIDLPPSYCPTYNSQNRYHKENSELPSMVIRGTIDGSVIMWWDREGRYYSIKDIKGIHTREDVVHVPEMDLKIEERI